MTTRAPAVLALLLTTVLGVAGCDDEADEPPALLSPSTTTATPSAADVRVCAAVTERLLRTATGEAVAATTSDDPGYTCTTAPAGRHLSVSWRLLVPRGSLDEVADELRLDLDARRIELTGGVPAWVLSGPWMDRRIVRLVTISDGHTILVDATSSRLDDRAAGPPRLARAARQVAEVYLG
jgi:hypothetical protein